jgi:filamentous hemagglutinin
MKNKTSHTMKYYRLSFGRRLTAGFMAAFMLMQICLPTVAFAATILGSDKITGQLLSNSEYQGSASSSYLFEKATYLNQTAPIQNETIETFFKSIVAAKIALPKPTLVPIAGDITIFIPVYLLGKLVGDAYVQTRFVRTQINDLLGRHLIDVGLYPTEIAQINMLYKRAKDFAISNTQYRFGDNLPASQTISADMIWPELRNINGQNVLVPIVYLTANTITTRGVKGHAIDFNGPVTEFGGITLDKTVLNVRRDSYLSVMRTLTNNGGTINLGDNATLNSNTIINNGGSINGAGNLTITANGSLQNLSGTISATQNLDITAAQFTNKTVVYPYTDKYGTGGYLGPISVISAGTRDANGNISNVGNLSIKSTKGDINFIGSDATATGTMTLDAKGNINILGVTIESNSNGRDGHWQVATNSVEVFKSHLTAQENLRLIAGGAINIQASDLVSTQGGIELLAQQGIYIVDDLNQEQIQKIDRKGKTTGQSSEFRTEAVRAILSAGKGVLLDSAYGDITLKASKITSNEGTQVNAQNGTVHLLMTKELEETHLNTVRKGTWTIKTRTEDIVNETNLQNAIVGGIQVQAKYGINVEYTGKEGATLQQQIEEYRKMPGMEWMAQLYDQSLASAGGNVNWTALEEIHKELKKTKTNLSSAAMAIIAIAVAVATGGAGAGMIGAIQGSVTSALTGAIGAGAASAVGAAMAAGALTLTTAAAQSLAAGNNFRETLNSLDSKDSLKALAVSMATAGMMNATGLDSPDLFKVPKDSGISLASLGRQTIQVVGSATIQAGVSVSVFGGNREDYKKAFTQSLATNAINQLGKAAFDGISQSSWDTSVKWIANISSGCIGGALTAKVNDTSQSTACYSAAGGALISQLMVDRATGLANKIVNDKNSGSYESLENYRKFVYENGQDISGLIAGFTAFALGGDVNAAKNSAEGVMRANAERFVTTQTLYSQIMGDKYYGKPNFEQNMEARYEDLAIAALQAQKVPQAQIDELMTAARDVGLFSDNAKADSIYWNNGKNIALATQDKALIPSTDQPETPLGGGIDEVIVTGVRNPILTQAVVDVGVSTTQFLNSLSPQAKENAGLVVSAATGGAAKTVLVYGATQVAEGLLPDWAKAGLDKLGEFQESIKTAIGTGFVALLTDNGYDRISNENANGNEYTKEGSEGLGWITANVIGVSSMRGNTPADRDRAITRMNEDKKARENPKSSSYNSKHGESLLERKQGTLKGESKDPLNEPDPQKRDGVRLENEGAVTLSQHGLNVEQLPESSANGVKNPDYKINGVVADSYAPDGKSVITVSDTLKYKTTVQGAPIVVVNLDRTILNAEDVFKNVSEYPVPNLKTLYIIKNGVVLVKEY